MSSDRIRKAEVATPESRMVAATEKAWQVALRLRSFGYSEIAAETGIGQKAAIKIVCNWVQEGRCIVIGAGPTQNSRKMHRVVPEFLPKDRESRERGQMWATMRGLRSFSPIDLVAHASEAIDLRVATAYCQALLRAGYLSVVQTAIPDQRPASYRLIRNTGPHAPRVRRIAAVFDDNLGEMVYVAKGGPDR